MAGMSGAEVLELYDDVAGELLAFLARRCREPPLALDLLSDTFVIAFEQRGSCRARSERERAAWIYRIAANELADHYRRRAREARALGRLAGELRVLSDQEASTIERLCRLPEDSSRVARAFAALSDEQRQAISLHVIEERPYPEVAARLGLTQLAARARVSRGLRALRRTVPADLKEKR